MSEGFGLLVSTAFGGLVFGVLYLRTDNLWAAVAGHFLNNTILNVVFLQTGQGLQSFVQFGLFLAVLLLPSLALIPAIRCIAHRHAIPQLLLWSVT